MSETETSSGHGASSRSDGRPTPTLKVTDLRVRYGGVKAVQGVSFTVEQGAVVALVGHNGAGKSSCLQGLCGFVKATGDIELNGQSIGGTAARSRIEHGLSLVPEGWGVLREFSVLDNLRLFADAAPPAAAARSWSLERIFAVFPNLRERENVAAGQLSGGERQMLSVACSLRQGPLCLMLDEPTAGLSPAMAEAVWEACDVVRAEGIALVIVAQEVERILELVDHVLVMQSGEIALDAPNSGATKTSCRELLGFGLPS
jgi:branched-chain amino acid transport system ATP-binding protein